VAKNGHTLIKGVRGKVIDKIVIDNDGEYIEVDIRFKDSDSLGIQLSAQMTVERADLLGWKKGNSRVKKELL